MATSHDQVKAAAKETSGCRQRPKTVATSHEKAMAAAPETSGCRHRATMDAGCLGGSFAQVFRERFIRQMHMEGCLEGPDADRMQRT